MKMLQKEIRQNLPLASIKSINLLLEGHNRYVRGQPLARDFMAERALASRRQKPFATVVTCSDSRVSPELIFDAGLGQIFVVRAAGNVLSPITIASVEYSVEHLGVPLVVILGHTKCGAVKAAWDGCSGHNHIGDAPEMKNLSALVKIIEPSVLKAMASGKDAEAAARLNIAAQISILFNESPICARLVSEGKLGIVGAKYDLESGTVKIIS